MIFGVFLFGNFGHIACHFDESMRIGCVDFDTLIMIDFDIEIVFALRRPFWDMAGGNEEFVLIKAHRIGELSTRETHIDLLP